MVETMSTIGVAIAIPEPAATDLRRRRRSYGDELAGQIPTHVTLLPPNAVSESELPDVAKHLHEVATRHAPFELYLYGSDTFRPISPVVFVTVATGISECERLATDVRSGPLQRDLVFPFHPHVTVAHDLPEHVLDQAYQELANYECRFTVNSFGLFEHADGRGWSSQREFALAGD